MGELARPLRRVAGSAVVCVLLAAVFAGAHSACGLEVVGTGPPDDVAIVPIREGGIIEDAASFDGDATQGGCTGSRTVCGATCTDLSADPANCGACGKSCGLGETCNNTKCEVLCVGDTVACGNTCINPATDPLNCGTCDHACPPQVCVNKSCQDNCAPTQERCTPDGGLGASTDGGQLSYCATTATDQNNCGACFHACKSTQSCVGGMCKDLCTTPATVGDVFAPNMVGCVLTRVTWDQRAQLCPPGSTVCSAAQWVARHGTKKPTFNYWTNDYLQWLGSANSCRAVANGAGGACGGYPMRVCGAETDPLGNNCNWTNCGYLTTSPNQFFGGCQSDFYAGSLCCTP